MSLDPQMRCSSPFPVKGYQREDPDFCVEMEMYKLVFLPKKLSLLFGVMSPRKNYVRDGCLLTQPWK